MYCDKCGKDIDNKELCCPYCGKEFHHSNNIIKKEEKLTIGVIFKNFILKSFNANGVASIKEFIIPFVIHLILNIVLGVVGLNYINTILNILTFLPICSLMIRRYHDSNLSGIYAFLYGYALLAYSFAFFESKDNIRLFLLISAIIAYAINFVLLLRKTNPNSKWNPDNGYL